MYLQINITDALLAFWEMKTTSGDAGGFNVAMQYIHSPQELCGNSKG